MNISGLIATIFCLCIVQFSTAEKCPGPALTDSQEDFKWKFDAAPIVAYGSVVSVTNNVAKFQISCLLKGQIPLTEVDLPQLSTDAANTTECHYLTASKSYIVFLQVIKPTTPDGKITYGLLNMEEIEITPKTVNNFITDECNDEEDHNIDMTIFYYAQQRQCGKFETKCNDQNKAEILAMKHQELTSTTTFLGGYKSVLPAPTGSMSADGSITGKSGAGTGDAQLRGAATFVTLYMPLLFVMISFVLLF